MSSVCLDESSDADADWDLVDGYAGPRTPSTVSDSHPEGDRDPRPQQYDQDTSDGGSDDGYGGVSQAQPRKKGGYDSRIEQILYENPDLPILITDAGKSLESGGKYIVYTIRTGVRASDSSQKHMLTCCRILKSAGVIPNLLPYEKLSLDYIRP